MVLFIINGSWHIYIVARGFHRRLVGMEMVMVVDFGTSLVPDSMLANCDNHSCTYMVKYDVSV